MARRTAERDSVTRALQTKLRLRFSARMPSAETIAKRSSGSDMAATSGRNAAAVALSTAESSRALIRHLLIECLTNQLPFVAEI